jgi:hypothetical protein
MNLFVLNNNTVHSIIIFENRTESKKKSIKSIYTINQMWKHLYAKSRQIPTKCINMLPTTLPPNSNFARSRRRCHQSFVCVSCYPSRERHNLASVFSAPHGTRLLHSEALRSFGCYVTSTQSSASTQGHAVRGVPRVCSTLVCRELRVTTLTHFYYSFFPL